MGDLIDKIKGSNTDTTTSLKGERNETIPLGCTNITPFSGLITFGFGGSSAGFGAGIRHMTSWIGAQGCCQRAPSPSVVLDLQGAAVYSVYCC